MRLYHFAGGCAATYVLVILSAYVYVHHRCVCGDVHVCTCDPLCPCWYMYCVSEAYSMFMCLCVCMCGVWCVVCVDYLYL